MKKKLMLAGLTALAVAPVAVMSVGCGGGNNCECPPPSGSWYEQFPSTATNVIHATVAVQALVDAVPLNATPAQMDDFWTKLGEKADEWSTAKMDTVERLVDWSRTDAITDRHDVEATIRGLATTGNNGQAVINARRDVLNLPTAHQGYVINTATLSAQETRITAPVVAAINAITVPTENAATYAPFQNAVNSALGLVNALPTATTTNGTEVTFTVSNIATLNNHANVITAPRQTAINALAYDADAAAKSAARGNLPSYLDARLNVDRITAINARNTAVTALGAFRALVLPTELPETPPAGVTTLAQYQQRWANQNRATITGARSTVDTFHYVINGITDAEGNVITRPLVVTGAALPALPTTTTTGATTLAAAESLLAAYDSAREAETAAEGLRIVNLVDVVEQRNPSTGFYNTTATREGNVITVNAGANASQVTVNIARLLSGATADGGLNITPTNGAAPSVANGQRQLTNYADVTLHGRVVATTSNTGVKTSTPAAAWTNFAHNDFTTNVTWHSYRGHFHNNTVGDSAYVVLGVPGNQVGEGITIPRDPGTWSRTLELQVRVSGTATATFYVVINQTI